MNIIPIIGKADSISKTELQKFKNKIMSELVSNGVQIYQFPTDDETVSEINTVMNVSKWQKHWYFSTKASLSNADSCLFFYCYLEVYRFVCNKFVYFSLSLKSSYVWGFLSLLANLPVPLLLIPLVLGGFLFSGSETEEILTQKYFF